MSSKIAIIGAGHVGSTLAYSLAISGLVREIVLIDADPGRAEGEAMDIAHAVSFYTPVQVRAGAVADAAGAAVTVIAAGAAQRPGETRDELLARNVEVMRELVPALVHANPDGQLLVATNPVDTLTLAALRLSGLPPTRVYGSGTVLDTARLRAELAARYDIDARNVHAYVLGEHGDRELVAWSAASVGGIALDTWCSMAGLCWGPGEKDDVERRVRNAAYEIIQRKGATNYAIAASLRRIIEAVVRDQGSVLTVSSLVEGHYGIDGVCLSLPAVIDRGGVRRVLPLPLSPEETNRLHHSASAVATMAAAAGLNAPPAQA
jgi:L-lactate dehydrogenase